MSLFLTMLPLYLFGNLHCIGMCGPLVMMLGRHRFRSFYFLGRAISFTLAGLIAGGIGTVLTLALQTYHLAAFLSLCLGGVIFFLGIQLISGQNLVLSRPISKMLNPANQWLASLMLKDRAWSTFLFGFFTLLLPCGQTVVVFAACALADDAWVGGANGLAFALLTSPSLWLAMNAQALLRSLSQYYNWLSGGCMIVIGGLAICRGLAELNLLEHWIVQPTNSSLYHLVLY